MEWKDTQRALSELRDLGHGYTFITELTELSRAATEGDSNAMAIMEQMLTSCTNQKDWSAQNRWCSLALKSLAHTRTPQSMKIILGYIRRLQNDVPFGVIDMISSLLPVYRRIIHGPARELLEDKTSPVRRAIGMQTLCNLYLEGSLKGDHAAYLERLVQYFEPDRYMTQHHVELVRSFISNRRLLSKRFTDELAADSTTNAKADAGGKTVDDPENADDAEVDAAQERTEQEIMDSIMELLDE